jgi:hypothetical protein
MPARIGVLWHRRQKTRHLKWYLVSQLAEIWREDGLDVVFLRGTGRFIPADVLIVHVDVSVVPDDYLDFAARYPIALNRKVTDIRKSTFSTQRYEPGSGYAGPVIVKSNLNHGGRPERVLAPLPAPRRSLEYRVYDRPEDLPARILRDHALIVEQFIPETDGHMFYVRNFDFLGDSVTCVRLGSPSPVVRWDTHVRDEEIDPHPELLELRQRLCLDFGELDYVERERHVQLFDANKTLGTSAPPLTAAQVARRRHLAAGIYSYLG